MHGAKTFKKCDSIEEREKTNKMQKSDVYYQLLSQHVSGIIAVLASYNAAPHNRYQPHPAEPEQYTTCSNTRPLFS
jgi:hypothetical protein